MDYRLIAFVTYCPDTATPWKKWRLPSLDRINNKDGRKLYQMLAIIQDSSEKRCLEQIYRCFPDASSTNVERTGAFELCMRVVKANVPEKDL